MKPNELALPVCLVEPEWTLSLCCWQQRRPLRVVVCCAERRGFYQEASFSSAAHFVHRSTVWQNPTTNKGSENDAVNYEVEKKSLSKRFNGRGVKLWLILVVVVVVVELTSLWRRV